MIQYTLNDIYNKQVGIKDFLDQQIDNLIKQGCRSVKNLSSCVYRGSNGTKCLIGFCIPDNLYDERFEGMDFKSLITLYNDELIGGWSNLESEWVYLMNGLLSKFQEVHDYLQLSDPFGTRPFNVSVTNRYNEFLDKNYDLIQELQQMLEVK